MQNGKTLEELEKILALPVRETVQKAHLEIGKLQEIRLGVGRPLTLWYRGREMFLTEEGREMGRAQVMHAEAAGIKPSVLMNPILL